MAEQSLGMATGTGAAFGDGNVGTGYPTSRMTAMENQTLSQGILLDGLNLAVTGLATNTVTINSGAAIVDGYFYENTSNADINISTLANGIYYVVILVNNNSSTYAVARSVSGTTIPVYSVRAAVLTAAAYSGLSGNSYLTLAYIEILSTSVNVLEPSYIYAESRHLPYQSYVSMGGGTATLTVANTIYTVGYSSSTASPDALFDDSGSATGDLVIQRAGLYNVSFSGAFSTGTTGIRGMSIYSGATELLDIRPIVNGSSVQKIILAGSFEVASAPVTITSRAYSSVSLQSFSGGKLVISRA